MRLSQTGLGTIRVNNLDKSYPAQDILLQTNQLVQYGTGIYAYNNVPLKLRENVESVIKGVLDKYGCIEILLPTLQPAKLWEESGRLSKYIEEGVMLSVKTDKGDFVMAPTAEEAVTDFVRGRISSYKNLPVTLYQIGEKYRNEIRTRGYLLRGKTFPMMDAYSFDLNAEECAKTYQKIRKAYLEIFEILGLNAKPVAADSGAMGGNLSEEFMLESPIGEDTILVDKATGVAFNTEILEREDADEYLKEKYGVQDKENVEAKKSIELGHIFQLGTKYTESMNAKYIDQDGNEQLLYMGCYGIGVSRTVATIYEENVVNGKNGEPYAEYPESYLYIASIADTLSLSINDMVKLLYDIDEVQQKYGYSHLEVEKFINHNIAAYTVSAIRGWIFELYIRTIIAFGGWIIERL